MEDTTDIAILNLLLKATQKGLMVWKIIEDDDLDLFTSNIGPDSFEIELINLHRSGEEICERSLARIQGKKIYQTYAIGTKGFELLLSMLQENISGWKDASTKADARLIKLKKRLEIEIADQSSSRKLPNKAAGRFGRDQNKRERS